MIFLQAFTTEFRVHWGQHLLRPEFAESTYYLYKVRSTFTASSTELLRVGCVTEAICWSLQATGDPYYLRVGQSIVEKLNAYARVPCGFAAVQDVRTGMHEDRWVNRITRRRTCCLKPEEGGLLHPNLSDCVFSCVCRPVCAQDGLVLSG